jgi:hypothetical protein
MAAKRKGTKKNVEAHPVTDALRNAYNQMHLAVDEAKASGLPESLQKRLRTIESTVADSVINTTKRIEARRKRKLAEQVRDLAKAERKTKLQERIKKLQTQVENM